MSKQTEQEPEASVHSDLLIEGHSYDGIQEYDNPMPSWWLTIFFITIVWSLFYVVGIYTGFVNTYEDDLTQAQRAHELVTQAHAQATPTVDEAMIAALVGDADVLTRGKNAYMGSCAACHGDVGQGLIGPNLADNSWLYGGSLKEVYTSVNDGIPANGMPGWAPILTQADILATVVFIDSIRNTNPPNGKAAQGTPYEP